MLTAVSGIAIAPLTPPDSALTSSSGHNYPVEKEQTGAHNLQSIATGGAGAGVPELKLPRRLPARENCRESCAAGVKGSGMCAGLKADYHLSQKRALHCDAT